MVQNQGNLLKGIIIWFVRREEIEPIKRDSSLFITKWFKIAVFIYNKISKKKIFVVTWSTLFVKS
jgi:hypothetical protein